MADWRARIRDGIRDGSFCLAIVVPDEPSCAWETQLYARPRSWISIFLSGNEPSSYAFVLKMNMVGIIFEGILSRTNSSYHSEKISCQDSENSREHGQGQFCPSLGSSLPDLIAILIYEPNQNGYVTSAWLKRVLRAEASRVCATVARMPAGSFSPRTQRE